MKKRIFSVLAIALLLIFQVYAIDSGEQISRSVDGSAAYKVINISTGTSAISGYEAENDNSVLMKLYLTGSNHSDSSTVYFTNSGGGMVHNIPTGSAYELQINAGTIMKVESTGVTVTGDLAATNLSGTNTGDQTSIVGITGTMSQFDTAVTDGDFSYDGHSHPVSDLSGGNWKVWYTNGSGVVTEIGLGSSGQVLTSAGATSAPSFSTLPGGVEDLGDLGDVTLSTLGANSEFLMWDGSSAWKNYTHSESSLWKITESASIRPAKYLYFWATGNTGDSQDGNWRVGLTADGLEWEKYETDSWVTKETKS
jgi:hypothetical protein